MYALVQQTNALFMHLLKEYVGFESTPMGPKRVNKLCIVEKNIDYENQLFMFEQPIRVRIYW